MAQNNKYKNIPNKVVQDPNNKRKFTIDKANPSEAGPYEVDAVDIEVASDSGYQVKKLSVAELPNTMKEKGKTSDPVAIRWFTNFSVIKGSNPTTDAYTVKIPGLTGLLNNGSSKLVICYGNDQFEYYTGSINNGNTIQLSNGDPSVGGAP